GLCDALGLLEAQAALEAEEETTVLPQEHVLRDPSPKREAVRPPRVDVLMGCRDPERPAAVHASPNVRPPVAEVGSKPLPNDVALLCGQDRCPGNRAEQQQVRVWLPPEQRQPEDRSSTGPVLSEADSVRRAQPLEPRDRRHEGKSPLRLPQRYRRTCPAAQILRVPERRQRLDELDPLSGEPEPVEDPRPY